MYGSAGFSLEYVQILSYTFNRHILDQSSFLCISNEKDHRLCLPVVFFYFCR